NLMCWAGIDRVIRVQKQGYLQGYGGDLIAARERVESALRRATVNGAVCNGPTDPTLDSSLLLLPVLNYPDRELSSTTVDRIWKDLRFDGDSPSPAFLYRYLRTDDFGKPKSPFLICSFWLVQALSKIG